jgi:type VI secretion system protein VasG
MIGAGGQAGQNDAANLLKPALARGEMRTVAATTWSEYKKYFEKDAALARRFQVVKIEEPSEDIACAMLRAMAGLMQQHFKVRILDQAIVDAVRLSARYISGRQLPDKAIGVLDTACAKVALGQNAVPAAMEERRKRLERVQAEARNLQVEAHAGADHEARLAELQAQVQTLEAELAALETRRQDEARHVAEIQRLRAALVGAAPASPASANDSEAATAAPIDRPALLAELHAQESALAALQGDSPLVPLQVDGNAVAEVVSAWTGVPLGKMVKDELRTVLDLAPTLRQRVIGQDHALDAVAERVRTARARLEDPNKPQGVFLFVGPSGVGKTETALALADALFGGERKLVSINMSEYQEAHSVSGLKGSPPGYVGYGEGGVLTEAVRRQPYSVVLLDEVEKAHPDVLELFYQVFDKGVLDDAEGREVDFRNTLIILTSNVGSAQIMQACLNKPADERPTPAQLSEALKPLLYKTFKPAFIGRLDVVPFMPIDDDVLAQIIQLKLGRIGQRVAQQHQARWDVDRKVVDAVLARCTETDTGARNVDHILSGSLLPALAERVLARMADGQGIERVRVGVGKNGDFKLSVN